MRMPSRRNETAEPNLAASGGVLETFFFGEDMNEKESVPRGKSPYLLTHTLAATPDNPTISCSDKERVRVPAQKRGLLHDGDAKHLARRCGHRSFINSRSRDVAACDCCCRRCCCYGHLRSTRPGRCSLAGAACREPKKPVVASSSGGDAGRVRHQRLPRRENNVNLGRWFHKAARFAVRDGAAAAAGGAVFVLEKLGVHAGEKIWRWCVRGRRRQVFAAHVFGGG